MLILSKSKHVDTWTSVDTQFFHPALASSQALN